jgi:hypothetical protein
MDEFQKEDLKARWFQMKYLHQLVFEHISKVSCKGSWPSGAFFPLKINLNSTNSPDGDWPYV